MRGPFAQLFAALLLAGCGGVDVRAETPRADPVVVSGAVRYGARVPTVRGASADETMRPARFVEIEILGDADAVIGTGATDASGAFSIEALGVPRAIAVRSHAHEAGLDVAVTSDGAGRDAHVVRVPVGGAGPHAIDLSDARTPVAGALHLLDTLLRGLDAVRAWTGVTLPPLFAYWGRGITTEWSFYRGERPEGAGRFCIELLGGEPGRQSSTDTDEHDEAIVLHELGHFVFDRLAGESSIGGMHARGALIDPGLAWEEGRATWFATAVLGDPAYVDTIGLEPVGRTRVSEVVESPQAPRGIGSETSVAGVLWDLADGTDDLRDDDNDGVALGPGAVLRAMIAYASEPGTYGALPTFLRHLVRTSAVRELDARAMLAAGGEPDTILPAGDVSPWPIDLALGQAASGKIDGLTQPAPSGGENRPETGFDAVHAYRVRVDGRGMLSASLRIRGPGTARSQTDLSLELRDLRASLLDRSAGSGPGEAVAHVVEAGWYVLYVRDAGQGNRADYELRVEHTAM